MTDPIDKLRQALAAVDNARSIPKGDTGHNLERLRHIRHTEDRYTWAAAECAPALLAEVERLRAALQLTEEQRHMLAFLLGEETLEGCLLLTYHPTKGGRFWWRENLRKAFGLPDKNEKQS